MKTPDTFGRNVFAAVAAVGLFGCTGSIVPTVQTLADEKPLKVLQPVPAQQKVLTDKPTTVTPDDVPPKEVLVRRLDSNPPRSIHLTVYGVKTPKNWDGTTGIYVFVNKPDADGKTPLDDMHFVHTFNLSKANGGKPENALMELTPALLRLREKGKWEPGQEIKLTFVPVTSEDTPPPAGTAVPYEKVVVEIPER